ERVVRDHPVFALGEPAPCVLVAHASLQRQLAARPLILRIDRIEPRAVALPERRVAQRELDRYGVVEDIAQLTPCVLEVLLDLKGRLVAELHAVRSGDVVCRRAPHVVELLVRAGRGPAAIRKVADRHSAERALLLHRDEAGERAARDLTAEAAGELRESGLE